MAETSGEWPELGKKKGCCGGGNAWKLLGNAGKAKQGSKEPGKWRRAVCVLVQRVSPGKMADPPDYKARAPLLLWQREVASGKRWLQDGRAGCSEVV